MKQSLFWNQFIRIGLEASLELTIAACYSLRVEIDARYNNDALPVSSFTVINYISTAGVVLALLIIPPFICVYYTQRFDYWQDEKFEEKFGSALDALRTDSKMVIFNPVFFLVRRATIAILGIFYSHHFTAQIFMLIIMAMCQLIFLLSVKPFISDMMFKIEVFNESITLCMTYVALAFN